MKHILLFLLFLASHPLCADGPLALSLRAESAILMNADTGRILYEKNAYQPRYPASTTKIGTILYALEKNREFLDREVIADQESIGVVSQEEVRRSNYTLPSYRLKTGGTHIGIKRGEKLSLRVLLYGLMLASANDAANVIAQYTSGNIPKFTGELNEYLSSIGCLETNFKNPHGLHHPDHKTTAFDLATMAKKGLEDPFFREIVSTLRYTRPKTNKQEATTIVQKNKLLKQGPHFYEHAIGIKTGTGDDQGSNIVAAAKYKGRTLIAVVMNSKNSNELYTDVHTLFRTAFAQPEVEKTLLKAGSQNLALSIEGVRGTVPAYTEKDVKVRYYSAEEPQIKAWLVSDNRTPPIEKGERIGTVHFKNEREEVLAVAPLFTDRKIKGSLLNRLSMFYSEQNHAIKISLLALVILLCFAFGFRVLRSGRD